nr:4-galactosyl-N-acetylglucosaminide 3-alpha-L-fucosyltransferase FUT6-like [Lytechinus pictus]
MRLNDWYLYSEKPTMGREFVIQVFFCVIVCSSLMMVFVFNANESVKVWKKSQNGIGDDALGSSTRLLSEDGRNDLYAGKIKRSRAMKGFTNPSRNSSDGADFVLNHANGSTSYTENRVLYKLYKASQNHSYDCVIRILKHHRPLDEEVYMNNEEWVRSSCEGIPCSIEVRYSLDLRDFWDSDVVVLMEGAFGSYEWKYLLRARPPGQMWMLYAKECPVHEPQLSPPSDLFSSNPYNLSMTYRSGSDIYNPYGFFVRDRPCGVKNLKKSELMMWMASRCKPLGWERAKFVQSLKQHLNVHTYGRCGTLECPKNDQDSCLSKMRKYKFYLSLENSECAEYITEKMWRNAFDNGMIPVVFGARKEDYVRFAPPNSFIHLNDFSTMEEFVEYINLLDRNETLYNKYFEWRKLGRVHYGAGRKSTMQPSGLCTLTKKLVEIGKDPQNSWRARNPNFRKWWTGSCVHQKELLGVGI